MVELRWVVLFKDLTGFFHGLETLGISHKPHCRASGFVLEPIPTDAAEYTNGGEALKADIGICKGDPNRTIASNHKSPTSRRSYRL
jgi:hypothetical protein